MGTKKIKILVIDDDPECLEVVQAVIAGALPGDALFTAVSGEKGIELARKEDPDVILLDIKMPGLDGYEVCRRLKADNRLKNIPVVFITSVEINKESRIRALAAGGEGFLPKPFETEELVAQIRAMAKIRAANAAQLNEKDVLKMQLLRESEAKYRALIETTGTGYLILDSEGRVTDANKEYVRLSGHKELAEILGRSVVEWTAPYEKEKNTAAVAQCFKEGFIKDLILDYIDPTGHITPVEISATIEGKGEEVRIVSMCRDITGRRQAEIMLAESEVKYRSLFNSSRDALMTLSPPSWRFTSGNPATLALFGVKNEEAFEACTPGELSPERQPDGRLSSEKAGEMIGTAMREGSHFFEWTHKRLNDEEFPATVLLTRIELAGQKILQATVRDITESRKAADALHAVSVRQETLLTAIPDIIVEVDNNKVHTWMNAAGFEFYGADALGKEASFYFVGEQDTYTSVKPIFSGGADAVYVESWQRRKDGEKRLLAWWCRALKDSAGNLSGALSTARDITGIRNAEAALLESKNLMESVLENVPQMIFLKEAADLRFVLFNRAGEELLGYDRKALLGKSDLDFFPPEQAAYFIAKDREVFEGKTDLLDIPEESILTAKKGTRLLHTRKACIRGADGAAKYLLGISEDITERKRAEAAVSEAFEMAGVLNAMLQHSLASNTLREKLDKHLSVLFALPWLTIQPKGAVLLMNPRGSALVLTVQRGLAPALLGACANVPLGRCLCGKAAETGQVVETVCVGEDHHITYEGMVAHGHCCAPIIAGGKMLGVLNLYLNEGVVLTDSQRRFIRSVTDLMAENIIHAQVEEKFAQSQRMESVGRLAGGVAHDFNNILTAIKCYAEFIRKDLDPQDPKAEDVREILTASDRAVALTRQLLAFSRRQIMAPKVADLNQCVGDITNMLRRLIGEDIALTTKLAAVPCLALLDTGQMEQVLVNLVVNARDAMSKGGQIELITGLLPASEALALAHPDLPRGPLVCLKVSDSGTGMTAEVKGHLFEPFFTTKEQGKGTGLGLSTVFGIVKQSGGDIEVESEPGKGTTFRIYFPYCESAPGAAAVKGGAAAGEVNGRETILLVEDEESLRRLGKRVLESSGYTVLTAASGLEALAALEKHGKPVDLLVTDVVMPGMSGRDLAREIARRNLSARTLYMSGYTDDAIVKHGVLEPGLAFIYKPFAVDGLLLKVRTVLDAPADQAKA